MRAREELFLEYPPVERQRICSPDQRFQAWQVGGISATESASRAASRVCPSARATRGNSSFRMVTGGGLSTSNKRRGEGESSSIEVAGRRPTAADSSDERPKNHKHRSAESVLVISSTSHRCRRAQRGPPPHSSSPRAGLPFSPSLVAFKDERLPPEPEGPGLPYSRRGKDHASDLSRKLRITSVTPKRTA